jgi:hypothetical protein
MKNLTLTLMSIIVSLLFARYYPYISKKLVAEYIAAAYLSFSLAFSPAFRSGKSINGYDDNLTI